MSYLDILIRKVAQSAGTNLPERRYWNFVSGATCVDNPATGATDITISGGGGSAPPGTGIVRVDSGIASATLVVDADIGATTIAGTKLAAVTTSLPGAMLAADKVKLDDIEVGVGIRKGAYNPVDYADPGDDITDGVTPADSAFTAMFAAMGTATSGVARHGAVFVPPGTYLFDDDLIISRALDMWGISPGSAGAGTVFKFARYKGIRLMGLASSPDGGDANYIRLACMRINGGHSASSGYEAPVHATWHAATGFSVGDKIVPLISRASRPATSGTGYGGSSFEYYYECIKNGTSGGGTEPDWPLVQTLDYSDPWSPVTEYFGGNVVRPSLATRPAMDMAFIVTTPYYLAGGVVSGLTEPAGFATAIAGGTITEGGITWTAFDPVLAGTWVTDGTCVWACKVNAGVFSDVRVTLDQVYVDGFLNAGVHIQAGSVYPLSNANGMCLNAVKVRYCGVGILTRGGDANAGTCAGHDISLFGSSDKELGIAERSFLGNQYFGGQVATVMGPGHLVTSAANQGGFHGTYQEADCGRPNIYSASFMVSGGVWGTQPTDDSYYMGTTSPYNWRGMGFTNSQGVVTAHLTYGDGTLGSLTADDDAYQVSMGYTDGYYHRYRAASSIYAVDAVSGSKADEGPGFVWFPRAQLIGSGKTFVSYAEPDDSGAVLLRHGRRIVGDIFGDPTAAVPGVSFYRVVTTAGYDGVPWTALAGCIVGSWNRGSSSYGNPSTIVKPTVPNGYVYRATQVGTTAAGEPTWPTTIGVEARTYDSANVHWVIVGDFIRPSTPNGHHYEITDITGATSAHLTGVEPTWPTTNGNTVVEGTIEYTCRADDTASWVLDGSVIWTCIGIEAVYSTPGMSAADRTKFDGLQKQGTAIAIPAMEIDWAAGGVQTKTLAAGANTFTFANATSGMMVTVFVTGAVSTLAWPAGVKTPGGAIPAQTASGTDIYTLVHDGTDIHLVVSQASA